MGWSFIACMTTGRRRGRSGIAIGMARELGWEAYIADPSMPRTDPLHAACKRRCWTSRRQLSTKLKDRTLRIVGDPALPVSRVGAIWGRATQMPAIRLVNEPIDVALLGYSFEWEIVEYVQDMISTGAKKGLILLGETRSEDAGMKYCAEWLKTLLPDIPVEPPSEPRAVLEAPQNPSRPQVAKFGRLKNTAPSIEKARFRAD